MFRDLKETWQSGFFFRRRFQDLGFLRHSLQVRYINNHSIPEFWISTFAFSLFLK